MAIDVVTLWNQAISAAGGRGSISDLTEAGREADLCRLWYPTVRQNVLKAASWPSAKKYVALGLLATRVDNTVWTEGDPAPTWRYAYSTPSDMLAPRYLTTYARFDRSYYPTSDVVAIMTNQETAVLHYVFDQTDVTMWGPGLDNAVAQSLAAQLTMPLTGKVTRAKQLYDGAFTAVKQAQTDIANEFTDRQEELPSWISARGYGDVPHLPLYMYPYEELMAVTT